MAKENRPSDHKNIHRSRDLRYRNCRYTDSTAHLTTRHFSQIYATPLIGLLNFCARAIPPVRAFNRRFCDATCGVKKPDHFIRVSVGMKEDITVWLKFLDEFNGSRKFGKNVWLSNEQLNLYTDSSGSANLGCGVYFCGRWTYFPWPFEWHFCDIMTRPVEFIENF
jgi:hypothetical protein